MKAVNLADHQCSGVVQCIHCGGPHLSSDTKCKIVKDYRAALTRNLLSNITSKNAQDPNNKVTSTYNKVFSATTSGMVYATAAKSTPMDSNEIISKKLDQMLGKMEEESNSTRQALKEIKDELKNRYEETKQQVGLLEDKLKLFESKYDKFCERTVTTFKNICESLLNPEGTQGRDWKAYWAEQVKTCTLNAKASQFLQHASASLSKSDYNLLVDMLTEWHATASISDLCNRWKQFQKSDEHQPNPFTHILCFNVRGFKKRWGEVSLLLKAHHFDIIALGEVGQMDWFAIRSTFSNFNYFYQRGENGHGGVLLLVRNDITA
ncbi:unnamed protein product, partial [Adineta steineri]